MKKDINSKCSKCTEGVERISSIVNGELVYNEIECRTCGGTSLRSTLALSDDLINMLEDMQNKINDIFQKVSE